MTDTNGWTEYKKLVIAELERLSDGIEANTKAIAQINLDINNASASIRAETMAAASALRTETTAIATKIALDKSEEHSKIRQEYMERCSSIGMEVSALRARVEKIETEKAVTKEVKTDAKSESKSIWAYILGAIGMVGSIVSLIIVLTECAKAAVGH